jgi:tRNA dimethylallyltransferase
LDPRGAKLIEKDNKRRLIRAIEVCKATKKPFWTQRKKGKPLFDVLQIGIKLSKDRLKKRIEKRISKMIRLGLEDEAKKLLKKYKSSSLLQTIGYKEWIEEKNENDIFKIKDQVKEKIATHTVQFAKRQMTWFKRDKRIKWIRNYTKAKILTQNFLSN